MIEFSPLVRNPRWKEMPMQSTTNPNLIVPPPAFEGPEAPVSTLCELFDRAVAIAPNAVALRHGGVSLT